MAANSRLLTMACGTKTDRQTGDTRGNAPMDTTSTLTPIGLLGDLIPANRTRTRTATASTTIQTPLHHGVSSSTPATTMPTLAGCSRPPRKKSADMIAIAQSMTQGLARRLSHLQAQETETESCIRWALHMTNRLACPGQPLRKSGTTHSSSLQVPCLHE